MQLKSDKTSTLLDNIAGKAQQFTIGTYGNCYLGLFTTMPTSAAGTGYAEPSSTKNYARIKIDSLMNRTYKSHALEEQTSTAHTNRIGNTVDIVSNQAYLVSDPDAQTGADWGTILGWGLFSSASDTIPYAWGSLETSTTINTHDVFLFRAGYFEIYMTDGTANSSAVSG